MNHYYYLKKALELSELKEKEEEIEKFFSLIQIGASKLKAHIKAKSLIHIVSHLDADGLSSAGLIMNFLKKEKVPFIHTVLKQISENNIKTILNSEAELFLFLDFGSQTKIIEDFYLSTKKDLLIIDHHHPKRETFVTNVNPYYSGLDGELISTAPLTYLLINLIRDFKDLVYLALVGAIGDMQENNGFKGLNKIILEEAIDNDVVEVKKGLNIYGINFLKLEDALFREKKLFNNYSEVQSFLKKLGLSNKNYYSLSQEEKEKLHKFLIDLIYLKGLNIEDFFGNNYYLKNEDNIFLKDLKIYSTFLNACGRIGLYSIADGVMLNVKEYKSQVKEVLKKYREEIMKALKWVEENKNDPEKIIEDENKLIINAENNIKDTIIGTVSSILINQYNKNLVIGISKDSKNSEEYKISIRTKDNKVQELIKDFSEYGEFGGHQRAGGGKVKQAKIINFLNKIKKIKI
ncbi:MAG TPA: DHH family phosphoesterase [Nautiliaceae bacterium]|nr:DHH family phosphoesterase [Nautiliaceae bacterium]